MTDTHVMVPKAEQSQPHSIMHPLVEKMMGAHPTPEALEKILNLQREWEKDEAKRAFTEALVELKRALPPYLLRDKTVDFTGDSGKRTYYTHTSLAAAMETVTPLLCQFGFSLTWTPGSTATGQVEVTAELTHRLGHSKTAKLSAAPETGGRKSGPQAVASTVTLLERYTALGLLGLTTKDMTEPTGEGAPPQAQEVGRVDTARNMRAMSELARAGKSKDLCEKFVGKPLQKWTTDDLDKLRTWLDGAGGKAAAADESSKDRPVTKEEAAEFKTMAAKYKLSAVQLRAIVAGEIGREVKTADGLNLSEFQKLKNLFAAVESGAVGLTEGKIVRPREPGADEGEQFQKYDPAKPDDIPF